MRARSGFRGSRGGSLFSDVRSFKFLLSLAVCETGNRITISALWRYCYTWYRRAAVFLQKFTSLTCRRMPHNMVYFID